MTLAPAAAFAAPTPGPTPAPQRAPSIALSPISRPTPTIVVPRAERAANALALETAAAPRTDSGAARPVPVSASPSIVVTPTPAPRAGTPAAVLSVVATAVPTSAAEEPAGAPEDLEPTVDWRAFVPTDTADHLATMDRAARESGCGVPWQLLAAIARVESDFGRNMATSTAGALGYGQFLPSSWQAFGSDGNVYDYRDALPAIAAYLCHFGLARDPRAALFAYNHAEWYVDMVLHLAVRYDRLAPGGPTPDVLDTGPSASAAAPLRYAEGRGSKTWLGIPWRGRPPGSAITPASLAATTLAMLDAGFGVTDDLPGAAAPADDSLAEMANRAWASGLLPVHGTPLAFRPPGQEPWSIEQVRDDLDRGWPVVTQVAAAGLPGHPPDGDSADQPLLLLGYTSAGLVYADPSFSSTLGYGLEISEAAFVTAWEAASVPRRAVAFTRRPDRARVVAHRATAEPPVIGARQTATPTPRATNTPAPAVAVPAAAPPASVLMAPVELAASATPSPPTAEAADARGTDGEAAAASGLALSAACVARWFRRRRADQ